MPDLATASARAPARPPTAVRGLHVPSVDGFRGLAVLWIMLGHCWNELGGKVPLDGGRFRDVFISSYMGVDLLFVASGFVLFLPVVLNGSLGERYLVRRTARLVPAFYAALIFSFAVSLALGGPKLGPGAWISHLTFFHAESHDITKLGFGVNGAMWTMSVEMLFSLALPLVAVWYRRRPFVGLVLAFMGAEMWHLAALKLPALLAHTGVHWAGTSEAQLRMVLAFPGYLTQFAAGMTAAWLYVHIRDHKERIRGNAVLAQTAAFTGLVAIFYLRGWEGTTARSGVFDHWVKTADRSFLFAVLILATALATSRAQWPVSNRVSRTLGTICYGTYLAHLPLIKLLIPALGLHQKTTSNADFLVLAAVVVPLAIGLGALSYRYIEEPFRRWARQRPDQRSSTIELPLPAVLAPTSA